MYNLIIYDSKYGTTEKIVDILEKIIGYAKVIKPSEFKKKYKDTYDNFIFVSPVYVERLLPSIEGFIEENKHWLKEKKIYGCAINMIGKKGLTYLDKMEKDLKGALVMQASLNGKINLKELSKEDYKGLKFFCENISKKLNVEIPFDDIDLFDKNSVVEIGLEIKKQIEIRRKRLDEELIKKIVYDFIKEKNTCVLATGIEGFQRATPLEYNFYKSNFYFISEGGIKFANLMRNENASLAIYNSFESINKLCGLQIDGTVEEVEYKSKEYFKIMDMKKINKKSLDTLDVKLHMFKFKMQKIDAIHSAFKKYGGLPRQTLFLKV